MSVPTFFKKTYSSLAQRRYKLFSPRGQSFIELALVLPVLLLLLLGVVEVAIFIGRYLDVLDLTREAARFASGSDPFPDGDPSPPGKTCDPGFYHFYYSTACIFSPPAGSATCRLNDPFCNGLNPFILLNPETDDVVISVYTVAGHAVTDPWPAGDGYWVLSDHDEDTAHNGNWQRNCQGDVVRTTPNFTAAFVNAGVDNPASPSSKGFVAVEMYYCYRQVLNLPIFTQFVPNPIQIHAYTIMSNPAAQPSPTPRLP